MLWDAQPSCFIVEFVVFVVLVTCNRLPSRFAGFWWASWGDRKCCLFGFEGIGLCYCLNERSSEAPRRGSTKAVSVCRCLFTRVTVPLHPAKLYHRKHVTVSRGSRLIYLKGLPVDMSLKLLLYSYSEVSVLLVLCFLSSFSAMRLTDQLLKMKQHNRKSAYLFMRRWRLE